MMKLTRVLVMLLAVVLVAGCTPKETKKAAPKTKAPVTQTTATAPAPAKAATQPNAQPAAEVWTCPMHPEVRDAKAGKCPKCGMDLVKAAAPAPTPASAPAPAAAPGPAPAPAPAPAATPAPAPAPEPATK